jgi:hypothetical protein
MNLLKGFILVIITMNDNLAGNFPEMVGVGVTERPLLRLDRHHPAFILTCKISYLKYIELGRRVKRFDFGRADLADLGIDDCVEKFYIIVRE